MATRDALAPHSVERSGKIDGAYLGTESSRERQTAEFFLLVAAQQYGCRTEEFVGEGSLG